MYSLITSASGLTVIRKGQQAQNDPLGDRTSEGVAFYDTDE